jgi:FkbM family methyltransferase
MGVPRWSFDAETGPAGADGQPGWSEENLRKQDFRPETLIDVGAGSGTPPLYRAFPDAYRVLIEPLAEFEQALRAQVADGSGEYLPSAVGDEPGEAVLRVDPAGLFCSSIQETSWRSDKAERGLEKRTVPITTLDALLDRHGWEPPFGLKIDTEGYELQVIRGAARVLRLTQFVIAEVSVSKRFRHGYRFAEFIALMDSSGFELCDLVDGLKIEDGDVIYLDLIFRRRATPDET